MSDPYRKVRPNEDLRIPARTYNDLLDAARAHRGGRLDDRTSRDGRRGDGTIRVKNETGSDLPRYAVVGLSVPIFDPDDDLDAFLREPTFRGVVPTADHVNSWAVLAEPAIDGQVVRAHASGVFPAQVDVTASEHTCAVAVAGDTLALASSDTGAAQILWRDEAGYGDQWAIVRLGSSCSGSGAGDDGVPDRCACPEDTYEVEASCCDCKDAKRFMPRFWYLDIGTSTDGETDPPPCTGFNCSSIAGARILMEHDAGCTWLGENGCITASLTCDGTDWVLTLATRDACTIAVMRIPKATFACCGVNAFSNAGADPLPACTVSATITPHECTCCPPACGPVGCGCHYTPGSDPCSALEWEVVVEGFTGSVSCEAMNGTYRNLPGIFPTVSLDYCAWNLDKLDLGANAELRYYPATGLWWLQTSSGAVAGRFEEILVADCCGACNDIAFAEHVGGACGGTPTACFRNINPDPAYCNPTTCP